ncbi:hypothetical protein BJ508DRAFT_313641 [Ascobolus immersus RN42]|uniref:Protein BIG1 n=1 Tax=Ascobolus immersus RN42 TaxID=1160509 RepID=A0A3N4HP45_ASCIM|nr:hypothetical protein BJ508DRAFT_313641 [Ascobolus immersus RN42]
MQLHFKTLSPVLSLLFLATAHFTFALPNAKAIPTTPESIARAEEIGAMRGNGNETDSKCVDPHTISGILNEFDRLCSLFRSRLDDKEGGKKDGSKRLELAVTCQTLEYPEYLDVAAIVAEREKNGESTVRFRAVPLDSLESSEKRIKKLRDATICLGVFFGLTLVLIVAYYQWRKRAVA